jgi:hypothetical protein
MNPNIDPYNPLLKLIFVVDFEEVEDCGRSGM